MLRPLELVFSNGKSCGEQISVKTGEIEELDTYEKFFNAYSAQMEYMIKLMVNSDNAIDKAHARRTPLPFLSSMVEDCIGRGKSVQEGGAVYNFTGGLPGLRFDLMTVNGQLHIDSSFFFFPL